MFPFALPSQVAMVKGKSKGGDPFEEQLAGKDYKSALQEVCKITPVQLGDFDPKAIRLLDALNEKGRALEACELLQNSLKGVQRKRITNWRAYVYSLIRKVDESVYHEMKESKEKEKEENGTRRRNKKSTEENLENPASAPSKKTLDKTATEFVPGKPWKTPEVAKAPEVAPKTLRKDAAEFVPTAQARAAQVAKAAAAPLPASLFPMPPPMPAAAAAMATAMAFPDFGASSAPWTAKKESPKKESKANGKAGITLKPDAQEFFPGVSAWAGAMVMPKQKAKAKPKTVRPRNPVDPGLVPSQPMSPGLQSGSRDADTAASSPSRSPAAQDAVGSTDTTPAISKSCGDAFASQVSPKVVKVTKDCREISGVFTASECAVILSSAKALGFDAGAGRLVSKDPWLASALWQRLSPVTPYIINGKRVVGLQDDLVLQYGARSSSVEPQSLAVQVCLKSSSSASEGHAYIVSTDSDGPVASWLIAVMQCQPSSWWTMVQAALGLGGPRSESRRMATILAFMTTGVAAALVTLLRRRQLRN